MTYSTKKSWMLVVAFLLCGGIFAFFYFQSYNRVENVPREETPLDKWTPENSVLNGVELVENKNIYKNDNPGSLDTVYITVFPTEANGETIDFSAFDLHQPRDQTYNPILNANFTVGDESGAIPNTASTNRINATIRVRGNSSRGAIMKSYKVKLTDKDENYRGLQSLNINKHVSDNSKVANKFCFDLLSRVDHLASFRTFFMKVYIRDASLPPDEQEFKYYGLYTDVEQPNKTYLTTHGLDPGGTLYKATNFEFRMYPEIKNIDDPLYDEEAFETVLGIREATNHSKLISMLGNINDMDLDFEESFSKYFDEENYLTWMAINILLGNEDTIAHNYILYNPTNSMTWYLLPWDYDGTFNIGEFAGSFKVPPEMAGIQRMTGVLLHRRYFANIKNFEKLNDKIDYILENYFTEEIVNELLDQYRPILEETMTKAPDVGLLEMAPSRLNSYLDLFHDEILDNYEEYKFAMKYPMPVFTSAPERMGDGRYKFAWEPSRDYDGDLVKYSIRLAKDYKMQNIVFAANDLADPGYIYEGELEGRYFMEVKAIDSAGNVQYSLDSYTDNIDVTFTFGVREVIIE